MLHVRVVYRPDEGRSRAPAEGWSFRAETGFCWLPAGAGDDSARFWLRARRIDPVPVYPPGSRGFQSALYKMVHIARIAQGRRVLNEQSYHASLKTNLARSGVAASGVDVDYISGLPWIVTEDFFRNDFRYGFGRIFYRDLKILFLQYTSGSTIGAQGCDRDPRKTSWIPIRL